MVDTIHIRLTNNQTVGKINFLQLSSHFNTVSDTKYLNTDNTVINGHLGNLLISVSKNSISIKGSIAKWFSGNNLHTLSYEELIQAFTRLGNILHIPIGKAYFTRLDMAANINTKYSPKAYYKYLMYLKGFNRSNVGEDTLYFKSDEVTLCLYDKGKEQKMREGKLLRYELRLGKRFFGAKKLSVGQFCSKNVYSRLVSYWQESFDAIYKRRKAIRPELNYKIVKTPAEAKVVALSYFIDKAGGLEAMVRDISNAQASYTLTPMQAHRLRQEFHSCYHVTAGGLISPNRVLSELKNKIGDFVQRELECVRSSPLNGI